MDGLRSNGKKKEKMKDESKRRNVKQQRLKGNNEKLNLQK